MKKKSKFSFTGFVFRAFGLVLLFVSLFLWLSIVTWSIDDPSLTHATANRPKNAFGYLGAVVSDVLISIFGIPSVLVPSVLFIWAIVLLRTGQVVSPFLGILYLMVSTICFSAAFSVIGELSINGWPQPLGGELGSRFSSLVLGWFFEGSRQQIINVMWFILFYGIGAAYFAAAAAIRFRCYVGRVYISASGLGQSTSVIELGVAILVVWGLTLLVIFTSSWN